MNKILIATVMILGVCCRLQGKMISVPVHYAKKVNSSYEHSVTGYGLFSSSEKYVFAFRITGLKKFNDEGNTVASVYMNTDNDVKTGRDAGAAGWDFQININLDKKTLSAMLWKGEKAQGFPLKKNDYLVDCQGDILYVAIRREAVKDVLFNEKYLVRIIGSSARSTLEQVYMPISRKTEKGHFEPAWNSDSFGKEKQTLKP